MKHSAFLIAFFTTIVQCYDYALFGLSAAMLSKIFMPPCSEDEQLLNFYGVFALSVLAKPVGAIIFGKIGDSYGRATSVKIAAATAAISTTLIGLTPNFSQIGWAATIILLLCRMVFLMSLAGEIDATRIYITEKIGHSKNFANGVLSFCSQSGAFIAAMSYHYAVGTEIESLWRVNFIIGGCLGIVVILLRNYFQESEEFLRYKASNKKINLNLFQIIAHNKENFLMAMLISGCAGGIYHFLIIFSGNFALKALTIITKEQAQILNIILIVFYSFSALFSGWLADKFNPKRQLIIAISLSLFLTVIMQKVLFFLGIKYTVYIIIILVSCMPFYTIPLHIIIQSLFTVDVRMRMCSLSHSLGGMIFSSPTPYFCMLIWRHTNSAALVIAYFTILLIILLCSVLSLFSKLKQENL